MCAGRSFSCRQCLLLCCLSSHFHTRNQEETPSRSRERQFSTFARYPAWASTNLQNPSAERDIFSLAASLPRAAVPEAGLSESMTFEGRPTMSRYQRFSLEITLLFQIAVPAWIAGPSDRVGKQA